jgi:hypothetical protein
MAFIREIAQQAIAQGVLTVAAEEELRQLLQTKYALEDFRAFMQLQKSVAAGTVLQESRELIYQNQIAGSSGKPVIHQHLHSSVAQPHSAP